MADELTPRALIRRVANEHVTYWATSPADRDRLDPATDELVGVALTRKRAVIGESHVWSEFCDTVALASEQLLWADEMSAIQTLEDPFGNEPQPEREDDRTRLSLKTLGEDIADEIVTRRHKQGGHNRNSRIVLASRVERFRITNRPRTSPKRTSCSSLPRHLMKSVTNARQTSRTSRLRTPMGPASLRTPHHGRSAVRTKKRGQNKRDLHYHERARLAG
jgi:hypothetical protein